MNEVRGGDLAQFLLDRLDEQPDGEGRRLVIAEWGAYEDAHGRYDWEGGYADACLQALRMLALDYADHPEFRAEWRI